VQKETNFMIHSQFHLCVRQIYMDLVQKTVNRFCEISLQSKSGGLDGIQKSGYGESQSHQNSSFKFS
jgi:hypothetical protein